MKNLTVDRLQTFFDEMCIRDSASSDLGRATKGAALALKARTLLYNSRWAEAAQAAKQVMESGVYQLFRGVMG